MKHSFFLTTNPDFNLKLIRKGEDVILKGEDNRNEKVVFEKKVKRDKAIEIEF